MKTAAKIFARAAYLDGKKTQDFSMYGAERRGAPVVSFVRFDSNKVMTRGYVFEPNMLVIADDSLNTKRMLKGVGPQSTILVNTGDEPGYLKKMTNARIYWVDGTGIALKLMGMPIFNAVLLGALSKIIRSINLDQVKQALAIELKRYGDDIVKKNQRLAEMGHNKVVKCQ